MPLRTQVALVALCIAICACCCCRQADAFFAPSNIIVGARARRYGVSGGGFWQLYAGSSFWKQRPGESDKDFFKRISQAASSPESFESASLGKEEKKKEGLSAATMKNATTEDGETPKKKSGYQSPEEWEAEQKDRQARGEFTWEERIQFEGQRQGNRFKQNEILRNNIKWGR